MAGEIQLHGGSKGVRLRLPDSGGFERVLERLGRRLADGPPLTGKAVTIDAGRRELKAEELRVLETVILETHGATLLQVVGGAGPQTVPAVEARGSEVVSPPMPGVDRERPRVAVSRTAAAVAEERPHAAAPRPSDAEGQEFPDVPPEAPPAQPPPRERGHTTALPPERRVDVVSDLAEDTVLVKRTLRSGQRVRYNGNVVVLGDVNPGAEVVASGDIVIMGTLRGLAHAGATGDAEAIVAAFRLQAMQLRIGGVIGRAPDGGEARPDGPEVARIRDGVVLIERYQPAVADLA